MVVLTAVARLGGGGNSPVLDTGSEEAEELR